MVAVQTTAFDSDMGGASAAHLDLRSSDRSAGPVRSCALPGRGWTFRRVSVDPGVDAADAPAAAARFAVDLDDRFTMVVAPVGSAAATASLLRSALHGGAAGVHVEFCDEDGHEFVVFRPHGAPHRLIDLDPHPEPHPEPHPGPVAAVVDIASGESGGSSARHTVVTARTMAELGEFAPVGPRLDIDERDALVDTIAWLAGKDPSELWHAAAVLARAHLALVSSSERTGDGGELGGGDDAEVVVLDARNVAPGRRFRLLGRSRPARTHRSVAAQLADAALANWQSVAGDADLAEATALRPVIDACHHIGARLRALSAVACDGRIGATVTHRELAEALVDLVPIADVRSPHVVVLPGRGLVSEVWSLVLDQLVSAAIDEGRQIVVVTDDRSMADWGRLEAHARRAAVVELR